MNKIQEGNMRTKAPKMCKVLKMDTWKLPTFRNDINFFKK